MSRLGPLAIAATIAALGSGCGDDDGAGAGAGGSSAPTSGSSTSSSPSGSGSAQTTGGGSGSGGDASATSSGSDASSSGSGPGGGSTGSGIAEGFPGDEGIEAHPDVIFADGFEPYAVADDLYAKWDAVYQVEQIRFATEPENVFFGAQAIEFTVPQQEAELSNATDKILAEERDVLYLRYYSKFQPPYDVVGFASSQ